MSNRLVLGYCDSSVREKDWRCLKAGDISLPERSRRSDLRAAAPVLRVHVHTVMYDRNVPINGYVDLHTTSEILYAETRDM